MRPHVEYWTGMAESGAAVVFGPVIEASGPWGLGILEAEDEDEARILAARDPVAGSGIGVTFDLLPMPGAVARRDGRGPRRSDRASSQAM